MTERHPVEPILANLATDQQDAVERHIAERLYIEKQRLLTIVIREMMDMHSRIATEILRFK